MCRVSFDSERASDNKIIIIWCDQFMNIDDGIDNDDIHNIYILKWQDGSSSNLVQCKLKARNDPN